MVHRGRKPLAPEEKGRYNGADQDTASGTGDRGGGPGDGSLRVGYHAGKEGNNQSGQADHHEDQTSEDVHLFPLRQEFREC